MSDICKAKFRKTRNEHIRAMQNHQRLKIGPRVLLFAKIFSVVLLVVLGLAFVAWIFLPGTSSPPIWSMTVLAAFCLYWLTFDRLNAWYWSRDFTKRPDANIEVEWRFSDSEIFVQSALGEGTVSWKAFFTIV